MNPTLLTAARASLPANARPYQIAKEVARLAELRWIADGRKSSMQMAVEAWERAEAAALEADDQARAG